MPPCTKPAQWDPRVKKNPAVALRVPPLESKPVCKSSVRWVEPAWKEFAFKEIGVVISRGGDSSPIKSHSSKESRVTTLYGKRHMAGGHWHANCHSEGRDIPSWQAAQKLCGIFSSSS